MIWAEDQGQEESNLPISTPRVRLSLWFHLLCLCRLLVGRISSYPCPHTSSPSMVCSFMQLVNNSSSHRPPNAIDCFWYSFLSSWTQWAWSHHPWASSGEASFIPVITCSGTYLHLPCISFMVGKVKRGRNCSDQQNTPRVSYNTCSWETLSNTQMWLGVISGVTHHTLYNPE